MKYAKANCKFTVNRDKTVTITGKYFDLDAQHTVIVDQAQLNLALNGMLVQDAFPDLSLDDREFLISGISPQGWEQLFGKPIERRWLLSQGWKVDGPEVKLHLPGEEENVLCWGVDVLTFETPTEMLFIKNCTTQEELSALVKVLTEQAAPTSNEWCREHRFLPCIDGNELSVNYGDQCDEEQASIVWSPDGTIHLETYDADGNTVAIVNLGIVDLPKLCALLNAWTA